LSASTKHHTVIIGAGAAGLICLKRFREAGVDAVAVEGGSQVGGIWIYENDNGLSSAYSTLHINTDRRRTPFQDFPFPAGIQPYPTHWEMAEYFARYAEHHDLLPRIFFKTWVERVQPRTTGEARWSIQLRDGGELLADNVVVATGHLSDPRHPEELVAQFDGTYLHSHYYRKPDEFVGKRVAIIGIGNSAADISTDICTVTRSTVIVARSGVLIRPKFLFGVAYPDITLALQRWWIPGRVRKAVNDLACYVTHGSMERLGFVKLTEKAHPTSSATIVNHILYNRIRVKNGIDRIEGRTIHFTDGTAEEFDYLIGATGYRISLPFLGDLVEVQDNHLDLYQRIAHPRRAGLFFAGFANASDFPLNFMFERQAEWILPFLLGEASLPSSAAMEAQIKGKREHVEEVYRNTPRHTIDEEMLPYTAELRRSLRRAVRATPFGRTARGQSMLRRLKARSLGPLY
jgi:hypothetical protein